MKILVKILDADLEELTDLHIRREDRKGPIGFYVSALRHFLEDNKKFLKKTLERLPELEATEQEKKLLSALVSARVAVQNQEVPDKIIADLEKLKGSSGDWRGEVLYVLSLCHEARDDKKQMSRYFQEASVALADLGATKKGVKALLNHVASESEIHQDKKYLREYEYVYRQAKKVKNFSTAAVALLNISYEYHELGAFRLALANVNRALGLLEKQKQGRSYYLAIAHRAHVLYDMGRSEEGRNDFEALQASSFSDLEGIKQVLAGKYENRQFAEIRPMPESWKQKAAAKSPKEELGSLEQRLLKYVAERPREKSDIIQYLYGDRLDYSVMENRFNNTLMRLKKKCPGLIIWERGHYRLSEEIFALMNRKKSG